MSDLYSEFLVKKEPTTKDAVIKYGMIILTAVAAAAGLMFSFVFLLAAVVAPVYSHRLDYYNSSSKMKTLDYSSGNPDHKRFAVITRDKGENCRIIIEPDEQMQQAIKNSAPSKVFLD